MASFLESAGARQLRKNIDWHLGNVADDTALLQRLEGMATAPGFGAFTWSWGPRLYARNPARFRPFILQHFSEWVVVGEGLRSRTELIAWAGEAGQALDAWLAQVDQAGDTALFRRLYAWKHRGKRGWGLDQEAWSAEVSRRFAAAATPAARQQVLDLFELHATLQEADAVRMYEADPAAARPFLLRHLPHRGWRDNADRRWQQLARVAQARGDSAFAWQLYRRQVPLDVWRADVLALAASPRPAADLQAALEDRHPDLWSDLGPVFVALLEARGEDALPYVRRHLDDVRARLLGSDSSRALARLAKRRGWDDFRIGLLVKCGRPADWNEALAETLEDANLDERTRVARLAAFSGVSREWNHLGWGLAAVQPLERAVALKLYERQPALLRTLFKAHASPAGWGEDYLPLFEKAWAAGDEDLADHLASRYLTLGMWNADRKVLAPAERVADLLVALKLDPEAFARRAAAILTRVPAHAVHGYAALVRNNRLARLLYERSLPEFLAEPAAVRDLVEAGEIHVQRLAYRVLGQPDPRARALAAENLDVLLGTLLRPLHRDTRLQAFAALANAAHDAAAAARVLARAREAFTLPDQHYPKEALLGLVGGILARHPQLAGPGEARVVYRRAA